MMQLRYAMTLDGSRSVKIITCENYTKAIDKAKKLWDIFWRSSGSKKNIITWIIDDNNKRTDIKIDYAGTVTTRTK